MGAVRIGFALTMLLVAGCSVLKPHQSAQKMPDSFLVFFGPSSDDLTPEGKSIVDTAAAAIKASKPSTVTITGYAFNVGTPEANKKRAEGRIVTVQQALVADGVDPSLFLKIPVGAPDDSAGPTGDRRIEIRLQFGH
jgi:outer membrane protein OmpA-like peptidoglycan-associated protein